MVVFGQRMSRVILSAAKRKHFGDGEEKSWVS
jgi:hypothetical protein